MDLLHQLLMEMTAFYEGQPKWIQHLVKVHSFAKTIAEGENMPVDEKFILEAAAIVHDIGIKIAMEKYGRKEGPLQEKEGPPVAEEMLLRLGFPAEVTQRVNYLVAHHHTYRDITGLDYQILVEADFLVNLYEKEEGIETIQAAYTRIFRTETGKWLCRTMFHLPQ